MSTLTDNLEWFEQRLNAASSGAPVQKEGRVVQVTGLVIESEGPEVSLGDCVEIISERTGLNLPAEVVGFKGNHVLLMPLEDMQAVHAGCRVIAGGSADTVPVGSNLLGRVIDGLGRPIDGKGPLRAETAKGLHAQVPNPMKRQRIKQVFETGVKAIDSFVPMGQGQRMGIFAGSGVGKSVLMGMIAQHASADVNVISLVGERGRELREFIENDLGEAGLARSVVVVSTSDQPAPLRLRAALLATRIAESFRDEQKNVCFLMDSVTRLAMAQREIGLAIGEPPASRGYTPSVFSLLPRVLERAGAGEVGTITALYTVLVEGDDMNEPIADAVRSILDGHIVLSRTLAQANHFPAIDVLHSVSRLTRDLCSAEQQNLVGLARDLLAMYRKNEDLINIGAYKPGNNAKLDAAVEKNSEIMQYLRQGPGEALPRHDALMGLAKILGAA